VARMGAAGVVPIAMSGRRWQLSPGDDTRRHGPGYTSSPTPVSARPRRRSSRARSARRA
jgi:hypothetical protein